MKNSKQNGIVNYIRVLLSISVIISTFNPIIIASAASVSGICIGSDEVNPGDSANVSIFISDLDNVTDINMTLVYDPGIISLKTMNLNSSIMSGQISYNDNGSGTVGIGLGDLDNLTKEGQIPVIDLTFDASSIGNSSLVLQDISLSGETSSTIDDAEGGYVLVEEAVDQNNAPEFGMIDDKYVNASDEISFILNANDPDDDNLTFGKNVSYGEIIDDTFTWNTNSSDVGQHYINFSVNDGFLWDYCVVSIAVEEITTTNSPPDLDPVGDRTVNESETFSISLNASDPDGDDLSYFYKGENGVLSGNVFTWVTNYDDAGNYSAEFGVYDGSANVSETITITVIDTDRPPVLDNIGNKVIGENEHLSFIVNATDPDGDQVTYSAENMPHRAKLDHSTGEFSWRPGNNDAGDYYVEFMATAGDLNDTEEIIISVGDIDQAPKFDYLIGDRTVNETELLNFTLSATDPDNDTVSYSAIGMPEGASLDTVSGYFSWVPDHDSADSYSVELLASANGLNDSELITITVNNVNRAPVLDDIGSQNVQENETLEFILSAIDADNDHLTYHMGSGLPPSAKLNSTTGAFSWTPGYSSSGDYTVEFMVSDGNDTDSQYVEINVENKNLAPEFPRYEVVNATEGVALTLDITAYDPDGDSLTYSTNASFGSVSGNDFIWTPDYDDAGIYYIEFYVSDGSLNDVTVVTVEVDNVNRAPEMDQMAPYYILDVGETVSFDLLASDPDGDTIIYNVTGLPESANSSLDENTGEFSWTPVSIDGDALYYAVFTASDGYLQDSVETTIAVNVNDPPTWETIGPQQVNESQELAIALNGSSGTNTVTYFANDLPEGSEFNSTDGIFKWTPSYDQSGIYYVEFGMNAGGSTIKETVTITVNNINQAPYFDMDANYTVNESQELNIVLNATDPDSEDTLVFSSNVSYGSLSDGVFTWTPGYTANQTSNGTYYINFTANDGHLNANTVVTVKVFDSNAPPVLYPIGSKSIDEEDELIINLTASDVDGDELKFSVLNKPQNSTLDDDTGLFSWTPADGEKGTYSVIFSVSDGEYNDTETVSIKVNEGPSSSTSYSGSGGSGGGGGALSSGEKYENIAFKDYVLKSVVKDAETTFSFYKENNSIVSVRFTSKLNGGQVKAVVEMLKDTSSQVASDAPGDVYRNMNIYVDTKLASDVIGNSKVDFRVEKSWILDNEIDISTIVLCRYHNNEWEQLPAEVSGEDNEYFYFTSTTPGFSPFAISSVELSEITEDSVTEGTTTENIANDAEMSDESALMSTEDTSQMGTTPEVSQEKSSIVPFIVAMALLLLVVIGVFGYRNRDYYDKVRMQIGNPDGKRYRRVKK